MNAEEGVDLYSSASSLDDEEEDDHRSPVLEVEVARSIVDCDERTGLSRSRHIPDEARLRRRRMILLVAAFLPVVASLATFVSFAAARGGDTSGAESNGLDVLDDPSSIAMEGTTSSPSFLATAVVSSPFLSTLATDLPSTISQVSINTATEGTTTLSPSFRAATVDSSPSLSTMATELPSTSSPSTTPPSSSSPSTPSPTAPTATRPTKTPYLLHTISPTTLHQEEEGVPDEAKESSFDEEEDSSSLSGIKESKAFKSSSLKKIIESKSAKQADKRGIHLPTISPTSLDQEEEGVPEEAEKSSLDEKEDRSSLIKTMSKTIDSKAAKQAGEQTIDSKAAKQADKQGKGGGRKGDDEAGSMNEKGTNYRVFNVRAIDSDDDSDGY